MSDSSQGPGWWQASDGKWYPPEQAPGYQPPSPAGGPYGAPYGGGPTSSGGTDIGTVLSYSWNKFSQNIGEWIVLWLIGFVSFIVLWWLIRIIAFSGGMMSTNVSVTGLGIILNLIWGVVIGILLVVFAKAAALTVSGSRIDIGALFQLSGSNLAAGAVFGLLYGLAWAFCPLLLVPVVIVLFGFMPILSGLDNKGAESIGEAVSLVTSNPADTILFLLLSAVITGCCALIGAPITVIGGVYLVKKFRGETVA